MPRFEQRLQRLYLRLPLRAGGRIEVTREQANYLINVLRMEAGGEILVFNGHDGEWLARIAEAGRRACILEFVAEVRPQEASADLHYLFAPLKMARLDYMVQKAVELGVGVLRPVMTRHTQVGRINMERMESNTIEAAEQCGILAIPKILEPIELKSLIDVWPGAEPRRRIFFCDENETSTHPLEILSGLPKGPAAVLVGPEGGFSEEERLILRSRPFVTPIPLGPRILRADTAAVAALALVQSTLGDW